MPSFALQITKVGRTIVRCRFEQFLGRRQACGAAGAQDIVQAPWPVRAFACYGATPETRRHRSRALGMELRLFSRALHKIKAANDLSGTDRVIIYRDGSVADAQGEPLGNLHDED